MDKRVGAGADADDGHVGGEHDFRAGDGNGTAATVGVRLSELHLLAAYGGEPALLIADEFEGAGEHAELDALLPGMMNFFAAGRHF